MEKIVDIRKYYHRELNDIENKLNDLEKDRYYEKSNVRNDGYLATNILALRKMLNELIDKIEYGEESTDKRLGRLVSEALSPQEKQ